MNNIKEITKDTIFGKLKVIEYTGKDKYKHTMIKCLCECGNITIVQKSKLTSGHTKSCGCLKNIGHPKHGLSGSPEYDIWKSMKRRCSSHNDKNYSNYGGRGIKVCKRWQNSFENFYKDIGPRPSPELSLDRIDNNSDYKPSNCAWRTKSQQARNMRNSIYVKYMGRNIHLRELSEVIQIPFGTLYHWLKSKPNSKRYNVVNRRFD